MKTIEPPKKRTNGVRPRQGEKKGGGKKPSKNKNVSNRNRSCQREGTSIHLGTANVEPTGGRAGLRGDKVWWRGRNRSDSCNKEGRSEEELFPTRRARQRPGTKGEKKGGEKKKGLL